jgi:hypothetical protein
MKPKGDPRTWWRKLDPIERFVLMVIVVAIAAMIIGGIVLGSVIIEHERQMSLKSCSAFGNATINSIPVRCLEHFGIKGTP